MGHGPCSQSSNTQSNCALCISWVEKSQKKPWTIAIPERVLMTLSPIPLSGILPRAQGPVRNRAQHPGKTENPPSRPIPAQSLVHFRTTSVPDSQNGRVKPHRKNHRACICAGTQWAHRTKCARGSPGQSTVHNFLKKLVWNLFFQVYLQLLTTCNICAHLQHQLKKKLQLKSPPKKNNLVIFIENRKHLTSQSVCVCIARLFFIQRPVLRYCKFRMSQGDYYNERMFFDIFIFSEIRCSPTIINVLEYFYKFKNNKIQEHILTWQTLCCIFSSIMAETSIRTGETFRYAVCTYRR